MSGIGGEVNGKLVTVQAELPESVDGIMESIRKIILMGEVQSITLKNGEPIIYQRYVHGDEEIAPEESTQSYAELSPLHIIRNVEMREFDPAEFQISGLPSYTFMWMHIYMDTQGWVPTHLVVSKSTKFWDWMGISSHVADNLENFMGSRVEREIDLPSDVFILCGSKVKGSTIAEIGFALKGNIEENNEQEAKTENN